MDIKGAIPTPLPPLAVPTVSDTPLVSTMEPVLSAQASASLDVLMEYINRHLDSLDSQISTLDNKAGFVLGSASLLIAGIGGFASAMDTTTPKLVTQGIISSDWQLLIFIPIVVAGILYLALVYTAYLAYKTRQYHAIAKFKELMDYTLAMDLSPEQTKRDLIEDLLKVIEANQRTINTKAKWTRYALRLLLIEAILVVMLLLAQLLFQFSVQ